MTAAVAACAARRGHTIYTRRGNRSKTETVARVQFSGSPLTSEAFISRRSVFILFFSPHPHEVGLFIIHSDDYFTKRNTPARHADDGQSALRARSCVCVCVCVSMCATTPQISFGVTDIFGISRRRRGWREGTRSVRD